VANSNDSYWLSNPTEAESACGILAS